MNLVKYYRRLPDGRVDTVLIRVTQTKREIYRTVRCQPSIAHPSGIKDIPPKYPTLRLANQAMYRAGWTRKRLYTTLPVAA